MNLRSLRIFRRVVTTGSLAQASQDLNISPSAASRLLSLLEAELKLNLFSRSKRRLELTEEGDRFYRQTEHILRGLDEMELIAAEIRAQTNELLSLVTAAPLAMGLISPSLVLMQQRDEAFDCVINVETRFDLESKVAARAYNVGVISLPIENGILDLTIEPFLETRLGVLMRTDHALAQQADITLDDLARYPIVALTKGPALARTAGRHLLGLRPDAGDPRGNDIDAGGQEPRPRWRRPHRSGLHLRPDRR
ncbi:LysR family transcriptional regulator [Devosia ginsengisoli]|uniref:LysR family transcriptional regulator n=1 Tax=Devosia ginsengisoli TaxID=400770 RepID=A0A5B8LPM1_9HYPH|nr:LysR family transcriptional regulator [Devosia ginsengisoli]QDZ09889.1 LysR family transcriptional regulator [Devosia ginsengisoli]